MARPPKNNCDYFPHDRDMRDHKKVKALRSTFGVTGYAAWSMILEYLTGCDGNVFPYNDMEFELMSGDFGISATEIRNIIDYCIRLELLFLKDGFINSESLDERLSVVYAKRGRAKELSKKQLRLNGKFASSNTDATVVTVTEIPQSKVKESKGNLKAKKTDDKSGVDDWLYWGEKIVKKQDQFWEAMKIRNVDQKEMDAFLSVAVRNGWTINTQSEFRIALKGFDYMKFNNDKPKTETVTVYKPGNRL